jgi:hypothetical protein
MNQQMTKYFYEALSSQSMRSIDFAEDWFLTIPRDQVNESLINKETARKVFEEADKRNRGKAGKAVEEVKLLLSLKTARSTIKHAHAIETDIADLVGLLFLPVALSKDGQLKPSGEDALPWMPREYLEPMTEPVLSIGKMDDYDNYLESSRDKWEQIETWEEFVDYSKGLFEAVSGIPFDNHSTDETDDFPLRFDDNCYIFFDDSVSATSHILNLYKYLQKEQPDSPLYNKFMEDSFEELRPLAPYSNLHQSIQHIGQMNGQFPLSPSQRESLHHLCALSNGEILAVNGPPGTGKTTLLQTIVANKLVGCALDEADAPVILVSSTNNQAVTNVIDSFGKVGSIRDDNLDSRWITGVNSFSLYFPSSKKKTQAEKAGYQISSARGDGFAEEIDSDQNIADSQNRILEMCSCYFHSNFRDIAECQERLLLTIKNLVELFSDYVNTSKAIEEVTNGIGYREYLDETNKIEVGIKAAIAERHTKKVEIEAERQFIRSRVDEWRQAYMRLPIAVRILSFMPFSKKRLRSFVIMMKTPEESLCLSEVYSYAGVITHYEKRKLGIDELTAQMNQEIADCNERLAALSREKERVIALRNKCIDYLGHMAPFGVKVFENKPQIRQCIEALDFSKTDELLDMTLRYALFWLSVHYYECRWASGERKLTEKQRGKSFENVLDDRYRRLAMITPCMVSTCFMLPKQFEAYNGNDKSHFYMNDYADLLIIDEAGQVSPEVAAPIFSLAKQAVVVGDERQIPPVWGTDRALDIAFALNAGVINEQKEFEEFAEYGLVCSESSVMRVASNSCKFEKYAEYGRGLFLSEHRRCFDEIIEYCNKLVYAGHLQPLRGEGRTDKNYPFSNLPYMGFFDIEVEMSLKKGTSRINHEEASSIISWIVKNQDILFNAYEDTANSDVLGIITPFKAQAHYLQLLIRELPELSDKISAGTVHTFQGAERKIIIFSTVYGSQDNCYFIDNNKPLINVAVSRARDSFLVFGARDCLGKTDSTPSGLLRSHTNTIVPEIIQRRTH